MRLPFKSSSLNQANLPPPIRSNVDGTWAFDTMNRRIKEEIFPRIIADNYDLLTKPSSALQSDCFLVLNDLLSHLKCGKSGFLRGLVDGGPDVEDWTEILSSVDDSQRNWLDAPWLISEFYFYRRVIEAFRYFDTEYDMFEKQKLNGLMEALPAISIAASALPELLAQESPKAIEAALYISLWGNKLDLSLWPSGREIEASSSLLRFMLDDHISDVVAHLKETKDAIVDVVVDNAGYELVSDLILTHVLISKGVNTVRLRVKGHPTFVSDATGKDCVETVTFLSSSQVESVQSLGSALQLYIDEGKLQIHEDLFWCQPLPMWDMPDRLIAKNDENSAISLLNSHLVIIKGDANYRRLLGDRHWPLDIPAIKVLSYFPVPVLALRALKAELGCGISLEQQNRAAASDSNWLVSGRWAVAQFYNPK